MASQRIEGEHLPQSQATGQRIEGYICHIKETGRYAFVQGDDGRQYFLLPSALQPRVMRLTGLPLLDRVSFYPVVQGDGRYRADAVRLLGTRHVVSHPVDRLAQRALEEM